MCSDQCAAVAKPAVPKVVPNHDWASVCSRRSGLDAILVGALASTLDEGKLLEPPLRFQLCRQDLIVLLAEGLVRLPVCAGVHEQCICPDPGRVEICPRQLNRLDANFPSTLARTTAAPPAAVRFAVETRALVPAKCPAGTESCNCGATDSVCFVWLNSCLNCLATACSGVLGHFSEESDGDASNDSDVDDDAASLGLPLAESLLASSRSVSSVDSESDSAPGSSESSLGPAKGPVQWHEWSSAIEKSESIKNHELVSRVIATHGAQPSRMTASAGTLHPQALVALVKGKLAYVLRCTRGTSDCKCMLAAGAEPCDVAVRRLLSALGQHNAPVSEEDAVLALSTKVLAPVRCQDRGHPLAQCSCGTFRFRRPRICSASCGMCSRSPSNPARRFVNKATNLLLRH